MGLGSTLEMSCVRREREQRSDHGPKEKRRGVIVLLPISAVWRWLKKRRRKA